MSQILPLLLIFIVIPGVGVTAYIWLCLTMSKRDIPEPPFVTYFYIFAHGGIWLLLILTASLFGWSGMSSVGALYLVFVSPFPALVFASILHEVRRDTGFHQFAYRICLVYAIVLFSLIALWLSIAVISAIR